MRRSTAITILSLATLTLSSVTPASAEEAPAPGWYVPVGLNVGGVVALDDGDIELLLGGEASAVYVFGTAWAGAYADAVVDFGVDAVRVGGGLEAGWFVLGAELGTVAQLAEAGTGDTPRYGLRAGALLTTGFTTGTVRWLHLWGPASDALEIGILLKWPFAFGKE